MKVAFFGTQEFSKNILSGILLNKNIEICLVVSQPDKAVGRKRIITYTEVKKFCISNDLKILQPNSLRKGDESIEFEKELKSLDLDFALVVAYGKIIPKNLLSIPKYGFINIHGSILPLYRGASPVQEAIRLGDTETGLTIMQMSEGMDEGDIFSIKKVEIGKDEKSIDIFRKFEKIGPELLINTLESIVSSKISPIKQNNEKATYCSKINKEDGKVDFKKESIDDIYNKYRAYYSWPGIFCFYKGKKINFEEVEYANELACGFVSGEVVKKFKEIGIVCSDNKILILKKIKLEGKKSMDILSFVNGNKDFLDYKF
ncbi:methionyl-tRNA formyltransferase [Candidatus Gracilibacteria bacterium]|nr:MAG: methionyl-tRNA formyltransferase [Candidatus Gracilibacteria bacterium]PIE85305.1 MAG: methionyl-tRNA formyltransferase [Candidatus Gracilibacteria bacterium]